MGLKDEPPPVFVTNEELRKIEKAARERFKPRGGFIYPPQLSDCLKDLPIVSPVLGRSIITDFDISYKKNTTMLLFRHPQCGFAEDLDDILFDYGDSGKSCTSSILCLLCFISQIYFYFFCLNSVL